MSAIHYGIAEGGTDETQEEVEARSQRFQKARLALLGVNEEVMDEDWYRARYPGFPDNFYPIFAKFSEAREKKSLDVVNE